MSVQKDQNSFPRFIYGLSRLSSMSRGLHVADWLNEDSLIFLFFVHKIILDEVSP